MQAELGPKDAGGEGTRQKDQRALLLDRKGKSDTARSGQGSRSGRSRIREEGGLPVRERHGIDVCVLRPTDGLERGSP
ncbi:MAG: hypothetical protein ACK56F_14385, partial [bacterium]